MRRLTTKEFIAEHKARLGNGYTYKKTEYKTAKDPVIITCKKHGDFTTSWYGSCRTCREDAARKKLHGNMITKEEFLRRAKEVHGDEYGYEKVVIKKGASSRVTITCRIHGDFEQLRLVHLGGCGCKKCGHIKMRQKVAGVARGPNYKTRYTHEEFLEKAKRIHGRKYIYEKTKYVKAVGKVVITCKVHGDFYNIAAEHLQGKGCPECSLEKRNTSLQKYTIKQFIDISRARHNGVYTYRRCVYKSTADKVTITCRVHGDYTINPRSHIYGKGICPQCKSTRYSKVAIEWVEAYAKSHRLKNVQHSKNGGEYRIPGTLYRADGYHAASKTILEFHGSRWHGDPKVFKPNEKCHPYRTDVTASELYRETLRREQELRNLGYKVIVMWESDYLRPSLKN